MNDTERLEEIINNINTYTKRIKEIDIKIAEKRNLLREAREINIGDVRLLPLIW